jgi:hypothetical protein
MPLGLGRAEDPSAQQTQEDEPSQGVGKSGHPIDLWRGLGKKAQGRRNRLKENNIDKCCKSRGKKKFSAKKRREWFSTPAFG